jgi:hypothetical protein
VTTLGDNKVTTTTAATKIRHHPPQSAMILLIQMAPGVAEASIITGTSFSNQNCALHRISGHHFKTH